MNGNNHQEILVNGRIDDIDSFDDVINKSETIIIYGARRVCYSVVAYMKRTDCFEKVEYIVVANVKGNHDSIMGIPVFGVSSLSISRNRLIIVATSEKNHEEICKELVSLGHERISLVSDELYKQLRRGENSFEIDILDNVNCIQDDIRRFQEDIIEQISDINFRLNRLEKCINEGVRYYDELLKPSEYPFELQRWYKEKTGRELDIRNPKSFNEKIQWVKLYGDIQLMSSLTDKYEVREWVSKRIGEEYLVPLFGVWNSFEEIDFDKLPDAFILKCTHGSAMNEIVHDKSFMNKVYVKRKFDRWMETNFAFRGGLQLQYRDIVPRLVAEKLLTEQGSDDIRDYKFYCFNGEVKLIHVDFNRSTNHVRSLYSNKWELLPYSIGYPAATGISCERPKNLDIMIEIAQKLAEGFCHVRVDLYNIDGKIYFGEMTFTHGNGLEKFVPEEFEYEMGSWMTDIPRR